LNSDILRILLYAFKRIFHKTYMESGKGMVDIVLENETVRDIAESMLAEEVDVHCRKVEKFQIHFDTMEIPM
jgi:hypothetical protein